MHPFLDVSKLTDEEIIERLGKAYTHMNAQVALGHTPTVVSIKEVVQSLEDERQFRMRRQMDEEFKRKFPKDNTPIEIGTIDKVDMREDQI
jgi:hypothetical protein